MDELMKDRAKMLSRIVERGIICDIETLRKIYILVIRLTT